MVKLAIEVIVEGAAANQGVLLRCARRGERGEPKDPAAQLAACSAAGRWRAGGVRGGDAALLVVFAPPPSSARGGGAPRQPESCSAVRPQEHRSI